jgi:hypothetical protein
LNSIPHRGVFDNHFLSDFASRDNSRTVNGTIIDHLPSIRQGPKKREEVPYSCSISSTNNRLWHIVPASPHAFGDALHRHFLARQPKKHKNNQVTLSPEFVEPGGKRSTSERRFEGEIASCGRHL